jgi:hypothetical protein
MWWAHEKSKVIEGGDIKGTEHNDRIYEFKKIILDE